MTAYGESRFTPFDPEAYQVSLPAWMEGAYYGEEFDEYWDDGDEIALTDAEWEEWRQKAVALLREKGFDIPDETDWGGWTAYDTIYLTIDVSDDSRYESFMCAFSQDGTLQSMEYYTGLIYE